MPGSVDIKRFKEPLRWCLILCLAFGQSACLQTHSLERAEIPKFASIAVLNKGATEELRKRFSTPVEGSSVDAGIVAGTGAGAGAAVAAQASLVCTYLVFVCAIVLVPAGAVAGAIAGSAVDAADDPMKGLSTGQILALESQFARISEQRTISTDIEQALKKRIPSRHMADVAEADSLLQFRLYDIRFTKKSVRKYALTLKSVVLYKWDRNGPQPSSTHRTYAYTSRAMTIGDWVEDDGTTMDRAFDACIDGLVDEMLEDIRFRE